MNIFDNIKHPKPTRFRMPNLPIIECSVSRKNTVELIEYLPCYESPDDIEDILVGQISQFSEEELLEGRTIGFFGVSHTYAWTEIAIHTESYLRQQEKAVSVKDWLFDEIRHAVKTPQRQTGDYAVTNVAPVLRPKLTKSNSMGM